MKKPKYIKLQQHIKEQIRCGHYNVNDRLPSENELAHEFNVSRHTVLKGMAQLTAEGWIERFQGKGTFVAARNMKNPLGSHTVALICSDLSESLIVHIINGLSSFLKEYKYELLILDSAHSTEREAEHLDSLEDRGLAGAFFWPHMPPVNRDRVDILQKRGFPIILLDRGYEDLDIPVVGTDNEAGAYEVTRHLIEMGHTRIAHITIGMQPERMVEPIIMREYGFRRALKENGITLENELIQHVDFQVAEQATAHASLRNVLAYEAMHRLLALPQKPTAVFVLNDLFAPSCMLAIKNHGLRVADDIALAGFDNDFEAGEFPVPLTSYAQPGRKIGIMAGDLFTKLANKQKLDTFNYKIPGRLIVRHSSRPLQFLKPADNEDKST